MGRGEDLRLALPEQEDEQRLRAAAGERGGLHLRGDEPPDGEEIGTLMRVFRQFQGEVRSAPVRWARKSRVVGALRVATPCYTMEQRTLPGRGFQTPKRPHRA